MGCKQFNQLLALGTICLGKLDLPDTSFCSDSALLSACVTAQEENTLGCCFAHSSGSSDSCEGKPTYSRGGTSFHTLAPAQSFPRIMSTSDSSSISWKRQNALNNEALRSPNVKQNLNQYLVLFIQRHKTIRDKGSSIPFWAVFTRTSDWDISLHHAENNRPADFTYTLESAGFGQP